LLASDFSEGGSGNAAIKFGRFLTVTGALLSYTILIVLISTTFVVYAKVKRLMKASAAAFLVMSVFSILLFVGFGYEEEGFDFKVKGKAIFSVIPAFLLYVLAGTSILVLVESQSISTKPEFLVDSGTVKKILDPATRNPSEYENTDVHAEVAEEMDDTRLKATATTTVNLNCSHVVKKKIEEEVLASV
jgi:hypothetical protein